MRRILLSALLAAPLACSKPAPPAAAPATAPEATAQPITFKSTPAGAQVLLDGKPLPGATPLTLPLEPGSGHHLARFVLDGYEPAQAEFLVPLSPYTAEVALKAAPKLQVSTDPSGASVELDGKLALPTTPGPLAVTAGEHELLIKLAGYVPVKRHLKAGERAPLSVSLSRSATLHVRSNPPGAHLLVDGVDTGLTTPADDVPVAAGKPHRIWAKLDKLRSPPRPVKALKPGQDQELELQLADLDRRELETRRRELKKQLAALELEQKRYEKKTAGFFVANAGAERRDEAHLDEVEQRIEAVAAELADLDDQLGAQ